MAMVDADYRLDDRYTVEEGRVYLSGTQALVLLPMLQHRRDRASGLNTAGFISGYRGSPLGGYDLQLWRAAEHLDRHHIRFEPGVNEDLAATAVWGSQQVHNFPDASYDGVFAIWYGKGPGVDRSTDALKHGNHGGAGPHGGVLVVVGDDHAAKSSTIAFQSEQALAHIGIPVLNPSSVQEYLEFGLHGFAMSRCSGSWVGFKALTDTVDSSASVWSDWRHPQVVVPSAVEMPDAGLSQSWTLVGGLAKEAMVHRYRLPAVQAYARSNRLDRVVIDGGKRRWGLVTTGKAYLDVRGALEMLGINDERAADMGLSVFKVGLTWPLEPHALLAFADGLDEIIVIEEKKPLIEDQIKSLLFNLPGRPAVIGKRARDGTPLVPAEGALSPDGVRSIIGPWLADRTGEVNLATAGLPSRRRLPIDVGSGPLKRTPAFCAGCPHNVSTVLPDGSDAMGGIGCHGMAVVMPERRTHAMTHMGGEGATWVGQEPFLEREHIFQNIGDGTYFHSGLLAIRANVVAGRNITYKILANGAVALTGGQQIEGESIRGDVTVPRIAAQVRAEGVDRIAIVSDEPEKYSRRAGLPRGVTVHDRTRLDAVQRELRATKGVTVLIYDQACAAEARRLRKRGAYPDPAQRVVINETLCEGCGDCNVQSNCISVEPVETEFGRKRRINQSSCNKDFSCLLGYCPSFVTVYGERRPATVEPGRSPEAALADLPEPRTEALAGVHSTLIAGIGGGGVVTTGALLGVAAHLEGKGVSVLDLTGLAQKNGPVSSHVRIWEDPDAVQASRIPSGGADTIIGSDLVVAAGAEVLDAVRSDHTEFVVNVCVAPTAQFALSPDLDLSPEPMIGALRRSAARGVSLVEATRLVEGLLGDAVYVNSFLLGVCYQRGLLPVSGDSIIRAIELNGRAVAENVRAFEWGRVFGHDPGLVHLDDAEASPQESSLDAEVGRYSDFLEEYQDTAYAGRFRRFVGEVAEAEARISSSSLLARAVARSHFRLLAYKDEYEVARLLSSAEFRSRLDGEFANGYRLRFNLAVQVLNRRDRTIRRAAKREFGPWIIPLLRLLARGRRFRGGFFDVFGRTGHRRRERALIGEYEDVIRELIAGLSDANYATAVQIAAVPEEIRGFDTVKDANITAAKATEAKLLAEFRGTTR